MEECGVFLETAEDNTSLGLEIGWDETGQHSKR
jgi:hypothetical protein